MQRRVDIDKEFSVVVKKCGGVVLDETLPKARDFQNADYVFHQSKVVAELKRFDEDKTNDPAVMQRFGKLWAKWVERGQAQGPAPSFFDSSHMPIPCQIEMVRMMGESIRGRIKKANAQIKATKSALNCSDYLGMLFMANDGNLSMEPPAMLTAIAYAIKDHFHEIDCVCLFSGNILTRVKGVELPTQNWYSLPRDETIVPLNELSQRMGKEWGEHYSAITGIKSVPTEIGDMEFFSRQMKSHQF